MIKKIHINEEFLIVDDEEEMQYETKILKIENKIYKLDTVINPRVINQYDVE